MYFLQKQINTRISFLEDNFYNYPLLYHSKFNSIHNLKVNRCKGIILNFGFKDVAFEKKYMISFFFFLELISGQKCVVTQSRKNLIQFKIKKGSITGCKVTLRRQALYNFLETLLISLPRLETFEGFKFKLLSKKKNSFSTKIRNLFVFYILETEMNSFIKYFDITFNFQTMNDLEKIFFLTFAKLPLKYN